MRVIASYDVTDFKDLCFRGSMREIERKICTARIKKTRAVNDPWLEGFMYF